MKKPLLKVIVENIKKERQMKNKEMLQMAGIDLKELKEARKSESFEIQFDEKLGFRIFDPFNQLSSYMVFRNADGWTAWSNEE